MLTATCQMQWLRTSRNLPLAEIISSNGILQCVVSASKMMSNPKTGTS